ncbi:MAG: YebC/PmpR family DNA-binding transcriptional regulator [Sedimentisphaerales bacterium]|nr:YebC/PmpR family DNA-binding transcriptional regulator [Sedimentisphaerales bacterium]
MSGHSHWAGIKHKKALIDNKRGKLWSKLARNVIMAAKSGGGDPAMNLALRYAIDKAKDANMPKDSIEKAIKRGTGDVEGANFEEVTYEGYGAGGVAVMCQALTDNRNRTAGEIRKVFDTRGGSLGASGCVAWMFSKKGMFIIDAAKTDEETVMEIALEAGADDVQTLPDRFEITCTPEVYETVKQAFQAKNIPLESSDLVQSPSNYISVTDENIARKVLDLMEQLEDHDDIQNVYANFDIPDDVMQKIEG